MKKGFLLTVALITTILSISLLPHPLISDARTVTSVTMSTIRNSCIVNNANIAVQNINNTPLDAINNWWGMPTGATHDNIPSGDAVGQNVLHAPHLPTMPFLCDLTNADWIPFSEQDLQNAINSHIPYLGGIAFALIDFEWGRGAKFDIVTHPNYGNLYDVAYISIKPNPTGDLITLQLDITRLPTDETVRQIVTCELVPLFVNSLQQVQNRYVSPSQHIASMVVMERDLMMRFSPPTEITPEPTPEFVLNYDASCLPNVTPPSETTPEPGDGESLNLVTIPPLEGEFTLLTENNEGENQPEEVFEERMLFFQPGQSIGNAIFNMYSARPVTSGDADIQQLTTDKNVYEAKLSPDGRYIAFIALDFILDGNRHIFVMRSDGSDIHRITEIDGDYFGIGWMPEDDDSQHITYSLGMNNTTYWIERTGTITSTTIHTPILVDGQPMNGTNPKWSPYQEVIYLSSLTGYVYKATWQDTTIFDLMGAGTINTDPMSIQFYDWAYQWNDVILVEQYYNINLYRYRDGESEPDEIELNRNINHVMTVPGTPFLVVSVYDIWFDSYVQRIELTPTNYILGTPLNSLFTGLYAPYLSPDGSQIHTIACGWLAFANRNYADCLASYLYVDGQPTQIFADTPIDRFPVREWDIFRLPVITNNEPTEVVCIAPSTTDLRGFRVRDDPSKSDLDGDGVVGQDSNGNNFPENILFNVNPETNVGIIYIYENDLNERWYKVQYDSNNDGTLDSFGWMGGDPFSNFGDCDRIPVLDENYNPIPLATYDYPLPPPPAEEDWLNRVCLDGVPKPPGMSDSEHYDLQVDNWRECSKIVYFVYYNIMFHLYESEPLLSDVLTSIYGTELSLYFHEPRKSIMGLHGASGKNAYELSLEALGVNYWISCDLENCHPPIGSSITSETASKLVNQYLYSINAWYADALALREWYNQLDFETINSAQDMRNQINILTPLEDAKTITPAQKIDLNGFRVFLNLIPDNRYQQIGIQSLNAVVVYREDRSPRQWGNHGYNREGYIEIYTNYNNLETGFRHDNRIVLCIKNATWVDNGNNVADPGDKWSDDIFVMITVRSLYPTSFYDLAISGIPDWSIIEPVPYRGSQSVSCDTALNLEKKEQ